ncbi:MAG: hypothetical protein FJX54_00120 [Alphaproteobacteria bacterium]|nr:hypothetical protein [Alphaproteobacteria bacterium]
MKHAKSNALDQLEPLLAAIRDIAAFKEKTRGVFYLKSRAALHFHEDPKGLFADYRTTGDWQRFPVNTKAERAALLKALRP